jgi:putative CocE/NonD family hydrolase
MFQTGPGDPAWRARIIDASAVRVPAFVVAGWRDVFCDPTVRAYEQIDAPKKLMVGPWLHTMPDASPFQAIDFRALCLRWWDHWLGGQDNGVMDELPVTLYRQGHEPQWLQFPSWPPAGANSRYSTGQDGELRPDSVARIGTADDGGLGPVVAEAVSDATVGVLSGQWSIPVDASGLPLDEHDDDVRALVCETAPLSEDLIIAGRPSIRVQLARGVSHIVSWRGSRTSIRWAVRR